MRRILLDEGVPKALARALREHGLDAHPFPNDLKQLANGALLDETINRGFTVLITNDKRMSSQQNLAARRLAVLALPTNRRLDLLPISQLVASAIRGLPETGLHLLSGNGEVARVPDSS